MLALTSHSLILNVVSDFEKNQKLTVQNKMAERKEKSDISFASSFLHRSGYFLKNISPMLRAIANFITLKKAIKRVYEIFLKEDIRGKEEIYLTLENVKIDCWLNEVGDDNKKNRPITLKIGDKFNDLFKSEFLSFEKRIKTELYGNDKTVYSQKELEQMASKYKDFPQPILENFSSDIYAKRYL